MTLQMARHFRGILVEFTPTHERIWSDYFKVFGDIEVTSGEAIRVSSV